MMQNNQEPIITFRVTVMKNLQRMSRTIKITDTEKNVLELIYKYADLLSQAADISSYNLLLQYSERIPGTDKILENSKMVRLDKHEIKWHYLQILKEVEQFVRNSLNE